MRITRRLRLGLMLALAAEGCAAAPAPDTAPTPGREIEADSTAARALADPAPAAPLEPGAPMMGGCGPAPRDLAPKYVLPFAEGEAHTLTQGNCGSPSHQGRFSHAFDFRMPMRTPVIAARDGVVALVRADRPDHTGLAGDENLVMIDHGDGEYSRYIHLLMNGIVVEEGDRVSLGDTIALSGDSGPSAFPHLHFDVVDRCGRQGCRTIPSAFLNAPAPIPIDRRPVLAGPHPPDAWDPGWQRTDYRAGSPRRTQVAVSFRLPGIGG